MAAYLDEDDQKPFQDIIARVSRTRHSFRDTLNLHCTLLSLEKIVEENLKECDLGLIINTTNFSTTGSKKK
jgi:hypothetical protein